MHSRFMNYSMGIKSAAFIPSIVCFIVFFTLILVYGRITHEERSNSVPGPNTGAVSDDGIEEPIGSAMKELDSIEEKQKKWEERIENFIWYNIHYVNILIMSKCCLYIEAFNVWFKLNPN